MFIVCNKTRGAALSDSPTSLQLLFYPVFGITIPYPRGLTSVLLQK